MTAISNFAHATIVLLDMIYGYLEEQIKIAWLNWCDIRYQRHCNGDLSKNDVLRL